MKRLEVINNYIEKALNETTDNNTKNNLESLRPKRTFLDKLKNKDISVEEYTNILRSISNILLPELIKKYPFKIVSDNSLNFKLSLALATFYNIHYSVNFSENKAKIYPVSLDEKTTRDIYENALHTIITEHITSGKSYEDIMNEKIKLYQEKTEFYKETLNKIEIEPYYGTPDFMYKHASFINECIKKLPFETENLDNIIAEMKDFNEAHPKVTTTYFYEDYPYFDKTYKTNYEKFEQNYLHILNYENSLMPYIEQIWQENLTNPNNHNNSSFKYIIHTFTENLVPPNEMRKACCSLASERLLTTPYGNCGLIYDFKAESIDTMCYEDAGSWVVNKSQFIDRNLPLNWQLTPSNVFYEYPKISKLILPTDLEKNGIANNLVHNHELLNYSNFQAYTEIFLNSKAKPIGVFYTDNCPNINEIKEYAEKYNLPLIHLSLQALRTQAGLNPIPTKIEPNKEVNNTIHY